MLKSEEKKIRRQKVKQRLKYQLKKCFDTIEEAFLHAVKIGRTGEMNHLKILKYVVQKDTLQNYMEYESRCST